MRPRVLLSSFKWGKFSKRAPKEAGMKSKNENSKAELADSPHKMAAKRVVPEREMPGRMARA